MRQPRHTHANNEREKTRNKPIQPRQLTKVKRRKTHRPQATQYIFIRYVISDQKWVVGGYFNHEVQSFSSYDEPFPRKKGACTHTVLLHVGWLSIGLAVWLRWATYRAPPGCI